MDITEVEDIARFLELKTHHPLHIDLLFVFGTSQSIPAQIAAHLLQKNVAPLVMLTGGSQRTGRAEATAHRRILLNADIAHDRILMETNSANTLENVTYALDILRQRDMLTSIGSVLAAVKWYHSRRAIMTLKRHFPDGIRYYVSTYEPDGVRRADWWLASESRQRVMKEWRHIPKFLTKGDIGTIQQEAGAYV